MARPMAALVLTDDETQTVTIWDTRPKSTQRLAQRAKIVLACSRGLDNNAVADELRIAFAPPPSVPGARGSFKSVSMAWPTSPGPVHHARSDTAEADLILNRVKKVIERLRTQETGLFDRNSTVVRFPALHV